MNDVIHTKLHPLVPSSLPHQHELWEIFYCTDGSGKFVSHSNQEIVYGKGDLVVIPPEIIHHHVNTMKASCLRLHIANATLSLRQITLLSDDENQSMGHLFHDVHYLFCSSTEYRDALLPAYGQLIAQHISIRRPSSPRNQLVKEIAQSILQNYVNPNYELDELLRSAPYCYDYLCRLFRQELNTTPHKYLTDLRMQAAADILHSRSSSSITEIAHMCGYHDPLYFSRMFKKKYGVSPREYGRQPGPG